MFQLTQSHGYGLISPNGGDAGEILRTLKTAQDVISFSRQISIDAICRKSISRVIIVVGSGMSPRYSGMSTPSWSRACKSVELFQKEKTDTIIIPTARFTYREFLAKTLPPSSDARRISEFLIHSGIPPEQIINEEWSNCTFGNAVFTRLILDACVDVSARIVIVTSEWALERAKIVFGLLFRGREVVYETVSQDLEPGQEQRRIRQEHLVNEHLYYPSINHYGLDRGADSLPLALWYLREINSSTPGNKPDFFSLTATAAVRSSGLNTASSYGLK